MSNFIKATGLSAVLAAKSNMPVDAERHTIRLHGDGHVLEGMELLNAYEGERSKLGVLQSGGGVEWRTPKGKKLFLQYGEFSFVINHRPQQKAA
jgi:hypothetical protein